MTGGRRIFQLRQAQTNRRLNGFRRELRKHLGSDRKKVLGTHTCIYATGSGGRGELSKFSDLDAFVLRVGAAPSNLDTVIIQSAIIRATDACGLPEPSGEGKFLKMHTVADLTNNFGKPQDDTENTFTARMLLLLESTPILGDAAYRKAVEQVIDIYWRNYQGHQHDYLPIILLNDIVRYWRIVLLNYEAKNLPDEEGTDDPDRRLRSYKLRFSRCMMCFSAVAYLLAATKLGGNNVSRETVLKMVRARPLDRMAWIATRFARNSEVRRQIDELLDCYAAFLRETEAPKKDLLRQFGRSRYRRARSREGTQFGQKMFDLIAELGRDNPLYRYLVV